MQSLLRLSDALIAPCRLVARVMGWLLLVLMAVILYDVIGRRFFATGSIFLQELQWHLHGAIAILAFGYAYALDAHVRIDVFSEKLRERTRLRIELVAIFLFLIPFMALLIWFGADFAWRSFQRGEGSAGGLGVPQRWIIKTAVPLAAVLTIVGALSVAARLIVALRRPDLLASPWRRA